MNRTIINKLEITDSNNFVIKECISPEYPYELPFHLDEDTIKVIKATLTYDVVMFDETNNRATAQSPIAVFIDGMYRALIADMKGALDLTAYIATPSWHKITLYSTEQIMLVAQLNIRGII
jgi:hypothetical protein